MSRVFSKYEQKDYQLSLTTPVAEYLLTSSLCSLILNQIAKRRSKSRVDILLPIKPPLQLFVWSESHLSRCLNASSSDAPTQTCALNITALLLPALRGTLSVSAHQKALGWHWAERFLNANNVIYCARLANELGNRLHFANCANMHADTIAHQPTLCNYLIFFFPFSHLLVSSRMQIYFTRWSRDMLEYLSRRATFRKKKVPVQPAYCMSTLLPTAQSHVTLPFTCQLTSLTPPLIRDLLSYLTFATIRHHPRLVEKLKCLIRRSRVHSPHTNATKSVEGPLVRTDR